MDPQTSFIRDALRDYIIHVVNPSDLSDDLAEGLKEKEEDLAMMTHDFLNENVDNYAEVEAQVAATLGSDLSKFLLDKITEDDVVVEPLTITLEDLVLEDVLTSSSSSSGGPSVILVDEWYVTIATSEGGNVSPSSYTREWNVLDSPSETANVSFQDVDIFEDENTLQVVEKLKFSEVGTYIIEFRMVHSVINTMQFYERLIVEVV